MGQSPAGNGNTRWPDLRDLTAEGGHAAIESTVATVRDGCIPRIDACVDVAAGSANARMQPWRTTLQTFRSADATDRVKVVTCLGHWGSSSSSPTGFAP